MLPPHHLTSILTTMHVKPFHLFQTSLTPSIFPHLYSCHVLPPHHISLDLHKLINNVKYVIEKSWPIRVLCNAHMLYRSQCIYRPLRAYWCLLSNEIIRSLKSRPALFTIFIFFCHSLYIYSLLSWIQEGFLKIQSNLLRFLFQRLQIWETGEDASFNIGIWINQSCMIMFPHLSELCTDSKIFSPRAKSCFS